MKCMLRDLLARIRGRMDPSIRCLPTIRRAFRIGGVNFTQVGRDRTRFYGRRTRGTGENGEWGEGTCDLL